MTYVLRRVVIGLLGTLLLAGCVSMTGKTAGENLDDASITAAVKAKLAGEKIATLTRVSVDTELRTVYLTGVVESEAMKQRAGEIAARVRGVEKVVNNLNVQSSR
jgi:hyperosmotically inducible periplasmic protein